MTRPLVLSDVGFVPGGPEDVRSGLLGYVGFVVGGTLRVDCLTLRRTAQGRLALSFPARRDRRGRDHHVVRPLDDQSRREIEGLVLTALREQGVLP